MEKHGKPVAELVPSSNSAILTKLEAADYLKVSPRFIERAVRSGRLRAYKLGTKTIRFRLSDLAAFLAASSSLFLLPGGGAQ